MPVRKAKHDHVKIYRPDGMRYADGTSVKDPVAALLNARQAYINEFGELPRLGHTVIEIVGGDLSGWHASFMETKE